MSSPSSAWKLWRIHAAARLAAVLLLAASASGKHIPQFAGPFISYVQRIYMCEAVATDGKMTAFYRLSHYNPHRPHDPQRITGNSTMRVPFDDSLWLNVNVAVRSNNMWKPNAFIVRTPSGACSAFRSLMPGFFRVLYEQSNATNPNLPCQVVEGDYLASNHPVDWSWPKVPILPYGNYRLQGSVGPQGSKTAHYCYNMEGHVVPRPSR